MATYVVQLGQRVSPMTQTPFAKLRRLPPYLSGNVDGLANMVSRMKTSD